MIEFLSFVIGRKFIQIDPRKVKSVASWPEPTRLKHLQAFLGFANFYRQFIKDYSQRALGMTQLLKKNKVFQWNNKARASFETLKSTFTHGKILQHFRQGVRAILETNASNKAIGGCLSQINNARVLRPIAFYSRKLAKAERNYKIYNKKMLAIVACLTEWRVYLEKAQPLTKVYTDHLNLMYFTTTKALNLQQARWSEKLESYDFRIVYRTGRTNLKADLLLQQKDYMAEGRKKYKKLRPLLLPLKI